MRDLLEAAETAFTARVRGQVHRVLGLTAESRGLYAPVGARCRIVCRSGERITAEVVGFRQEQAIVAPLADVRGLSAGDPIEYTGESASVRVGPGLIGRVIDAEGEVLTGGPPALSDTPVPLYQAAANPLRGSRIDSPLPTGVRSIDALVTLGRGQRLGIFSGSGVGKSVLLGMIARNTAASVVVLALIGERRREALEFVSTILGEEGLRHCVVVVATAEEPALRRIQAAHVATAVAEHFRDSGEHVLLLLDSLTRVASAQREIGLSCGEPPATKGYPPSVFSLLPRLLERVGPGERGSVTGVYTVLAEADDPGDPVADCARSALDGHVWLSRDLAERGLFPAVDPLASLSRVQPNVVSSEHLAAATSVRAALARYRQVEDLIRLGAYSSAADPAVDTAVRLYPDLEEFLVQGESESCGFADTVERLVALGGQAGRAPSGRRREVRS